MGKEAPCEGHGGHASAVKEDVVPQTPLLRAQAANGEVRLTALGAWTAPNAGELERLIEPIGVQFVPSATEKPSRAQLVVIDPTAPRALDSERIQTTARNGSYANLP